MLASTAAECEPHTSRCPSPFTLTLHLLQAAYSLPLHHSLPQAGPCSACIALLCGTASQRPPPLSPDPKAPATTVRSRSRAASHVSQATRWTWSLRQRAAWLPYVYHNQRLGPHVYPSETPQIPLKTRLPVCVGVVHSSRRLLV